MGKGKQVSIKDVALRAGTSIATVSRILNNVGYPVSDELRSRVETAIREMDYRPNRMAQTLRSKQTQSIGLIVRDISDSYFGAVAKGVTEEASSRGLMPLVCTSKRDPKLEIEYMRILAQYQVAGVILAGAAWRDEAVRIRMKNAVKDLRLQGVRVVGCAPQETPMPCALVDNEALGRDAFHILHRQGHTRFAILSGDANNYASQLRVNGFTDEARNVGSFWTECTGAFTNLHGYNAMERVLAEYPETTAVYATNDNIAVGALRYLEQAGKQVPTELSVLGTGDMTIASYTFPALSTMRLPYAELGAAAVKMIFEPHVRDNAVTAFPYEYIKRESVGPCR
jgi:Transcriptional regulators